MQIYATTNAQLSILLWSQKMTCDYLQGFSLPQKTFGYDKNHLCGFSGIAMVPGAVLITGRRQSEGMIWAQHLGVAPKNQSIKEKCTNC